MSFVKKYVVATMKHPPSKMIWGAMSCRCAVGLYFIPPKTTMNGPKYVKLLKEILKLHMHVHGCMIFMQDGAPCYLSKVAIEFLKKNKISVLEWPRNSPNLKTFKNLWTNMKGKVAYKQTSSTENLRQAIKEVWINEISQEYCESLVSSTPRCSKGPTEY